MGRAALGGYPRAEPWAVGAGRGHSLLGNPKGQPPWPICLNLAPDQVRRCLRPANFGIIGYTIILMVACVRVVKDSFRVLRCPEGRLLIGDDKHHLVEAVGNPVAIGGSYLCGREIRRDHREQHPVIAV